MSPARLEDAQGLSGFPRVSGDEPTCWPAEKYPRAFSPRERG